METQKFPIVRLIVTFIVIVVFGVLANLWNTLLIQYRAISAASLFANDDPLAFAISMLFRNSDLVGLLIVVAFLAILGWMWRREIKVLLTNSALSTFLLVGSLAVMFMASGCANRATTESETTSQQDVVVIRQNETAFAVPALSGTESGQAQTRDEAFYEANKVKQQTKIIDKTLIGGRYIPTINVIIVAHTPVSRLWSKSSETGTNAKNEAMCVEDNHSVNVCFQIALSAIVEPRNAAKFLFNYQASQAPDPKVGGLSRAIELEKVVDNQVHTYLYGRIAEKAGNNDLDYIIKNKSMIVGESQVETKRYFADQGITVAYVALGGELILSEKVQDVIDRFFIAEKEQAIARVQATTVAINASAQREAIIQKGNGDATAFAQLVKAWGKDDLTGLGAALESYRWNGNRLTVTLAPDTNVAVTIPQPTAAPTIRPVATETPKK